MLHVFHVDSGRMMTFDMSLALESVDNLKRYVQEEFRIAADKQVLLISGGECLDPNKRVCSYTAGTDTNPIFLFSKSIIESSTPPLPSADYGTESDVDLKIKEHCDMPVTFNTVTKRTLLAQQLLEMDRNQLSTCEGLVHDQHLQQQGWAAVVANLEDISLEFRKRSEIFEKSFADYLDERKSYISFLNHFNSDLQTLQTIPVLPALLETNPSTEETKTSEEDDTNTSQSGTDKDITLYDWIAAADNKNTMDQLYEHCTRGLEQFDQEKFEALSLEIRDMLNNADNPQMKEVKGLSERLSGLETLMREAKKLVKQQSEYAQSFANNQSRTSNTRDHSVLPDLCTSHKQLLQTMGRNHQQLCDIRRRCAKAKEELSVNLYHRLRWVMYIEDHILEIDQKLVIYHENLKRLRRHLEILQQIHLAPATYLCAVVEVVRRRAFSQTFLLWASELACHLLTIHNEELARRKEFQSQFEGHFLNSLFPGMEDLPPSFATQAPAMFDTILPKITEEDIERLKKELPDLAENINVPDNSALTNFFLLRSLTRKGDEEETKEGVEIKAVEDKLIQAVSDVGLASELDRELLKGTGSEPCLTTAHGLPHLKDLDRGCESETDTEEFEKVGQSPLELNFDNKNIPSPRPRTQDASTSTESSQNSPNSPCLGHQGTSVSVAGTSAASDFANDEFYIDESLPSSLSIETGHSQGSEFIKQLDTAHNVVALLQDNLQVSRSEYEKLKTVQSKLHHLTTETIVQLRSEISYLKTQVVSNRNAFTQYCNSLIGSWKQLIITRDSKEKQLMESIRNTHEKAINDLKKQEEIKNKQIEDLLMEKTTLESEILKSCEYVQELKENLDKMTLEFTKEIGDLRKQLEEKDIEKDKGIKEISDRLTRDHKAELENIRARFKLMTMERSPSDNNLDKSLDYNSLPGHSTLLQQMTENFELDKEKAVNEALLKEREKWEKLLAIQIREMEHKFEEEKSILIQNLAKKITDEKDKQIEILMEREKNLNLECIKHKSTIQQLTESGTESSDSDLIKKIDDLQRERDNLEEELEKTKNEKLDLTTSVAVCEGKVDVTTSPIRLKENIVKSESSRGKISIDSCKHGDLVLVLWDQAYASYKILQDNKHMFFLHSDYLEGLGLEIIEGKPNRPYCAGEVVDKEYCFAKKSENRYKVPKHTKFFRVKVKPIHPPVFARESSQHRPSLDSTRMTQSQSAVSSVSDDATPEEKAGPMSLPSSPTRTHPVIFERDEVDAIINQDAELGTIIPRLEDNGVKQVGQWPEKHFAEDSGIVDNVEQAMAAMDDTISDNHSRNESESSDRESKCVEVFEEQHTYISSTWLEMMLSRVFSKSIQKDCTEKSAE